MGFVVVMERGGRAGSGPIWKDCCHGDHSKRPKAAVDSQLITHWAKAFERDLYLFISFQFQCTEKASRGAEIASAILYPERAHVGVKLHSLTLRRKLPRMTRRCRAHRGAVWERKKLLFCGFNY